ncbi:unnamed protein product [Amoebophrya sp. A25]|nr:unnamed protein product [Amoebophrya sp. A25]|eukprot:GSA25T00007789001.1
MFLPAGRDVVATRYFVMPGDEGIFRFRIMFDDSSKLGYHFMMQLWGINWITISVFKIIAVMQYEVAAAAGTARRSVSGRHKSLSPVKGNPKRKAGTMKASGVRTRRHHRRETANGLHEISSRWR